MRGFSSLFILLFASGVAKKWVGKWEHFLGVQHYERNLEFNVGYMLDKCWLTARKKNGTLAPLFNPVAGEIYRTLWML